MFVEPQFLSSRTSGINYLQRRVGIPFLNSRVCLEIPPYQEFEPNWMHVIRRGCRDEPAPIRFHSHCDGRRLIL